MFRSVPKKGINVLDLSLRERISQSAPNLKITQCAVTGVPPGKSVLVEIYLVWLVISQHNILLLPKSPSQYACMHELFFDGQPTRCMHAIISFFMASLL